MYAESKFKILVADQTLRDGEQQVGVHFSYKDKLRIAKLLADSGVDQISMMPLVGDDENALTRNFIKDGLPIVGDFPIEQPSIELCKDLGLRKVTYFVPVSKVLIEAKMENQENILNQVIETAVLATSNGLQVDIAFEDASRGEINFIKTLARSLEGLVDHIVMCDTVGCLQPGLTWLLIDSLKREYAGKIGIHCHNDLDLAVENTVAAVNAGASLVSGTIGGIGERAGNADLVLVLKELASQNYSFNVDCGELEQVEMSALSSAGINAPKPMTPEAFRTEAGMHVYAMLQNQYAYSIFPGIPNQVWYGRHSGVSNYIWLFERELGTPLTFEQYSHIRDKVKKLANEEGRSFSSKEVEKMFLAGIFNLDSE